MEQGFNVNAASAIKSAVSVPVIAVGRINDPKLAEEIISSGKADMIAIGRQSLADPQWPVKVNENREEEIVKCLSCSECLSAAWRTKPLVCVQNPLLGKESEYASLPPVIPQKVLIAGGGPAGLEAARTAAVLGHNVMLFEKEVSLGGQIPIATIPPKKELLNDVVLSRIRVIEKLGVEINTGKALTPEIIKEIKPDVLIIATGSTPITPDIPGVENKCVLPASDVLKGAPVGNKVVIIGGGVVGCETADFLTLKNKDITIVEMLKSIAGDISPAARYFLNMRLAENNVSIFTSTTVKEIADNHVIITSEKGELKLDSIDNVILAAGAKPVNELESELIGIVPKIFVVGDAMNPGKILQAVQQAFEVVNSL